MTIDTEHIHCGMINFSKIFTTATSSIYNRYPTACLFGEGMGVLSISIASVMVKIYTIDSLVQGMATHLKYCSLALSHWYNVRLDHISMAKWNKNITPLLTHCSHVFLALTHWYDQETIVLGLSNTLITIPINLFLLFAVRNMCNFDGKYE